MSTGVWRWPSLSTPNDLAVVDLALPPGPLPRYPDRAVALFGKTAFVDDQARVRPAAQQPVGVLSDLCHHGIVLPRRVADEVLKLLRAAQVNYRRHRGECAVRRLRQSAEITPGHGRAVARTRSEEAAIAVAEARERARDAFDQGCAQTSAGNTVT